MFLIILHEGIPDQPRRVTVMCPKLFRDGHLRRFITSHVLQEHDELEKEDPHVNLRVEAGMSQPMK